MSRKTEDQAFRDLVADLHRTADAYHQAGKIPLDRCIAALAIVQHQFCDRVVMPPDNREPPPDKV